MTDRAAHIVASLGDPSTIITDVDVAAIEDALARHRARHCTGLAARWCPVHGDCRCPRDDDGIGDMDDAGCALHAPASPHAHDGDEGRVDAVEIHG